MRFIYTQWMQACLGMLLLLLSVPAFSRTQGFYLLDGAKSVRIPVEIKHNIILISLRINHSLDLKFILDTGVRTTILTEPLMMGMLKLDSLSPINVRGLGDGPPIAAALARNVTIELPGTIGKGLDMIVLPEGAISYGEMFGHEIYGIIGAELFAQFIVEINYQQKYITLRDPFHFHPKKKFHSLPITLIKGKPYVEAEVEDHQGVLMKRLWLLDTGASQGISFYDPTLELPDQKVETFLGKGLSGDVFGYIGRAKQFSLAGYQFDAPIVGYPDSTSISLLGDSITWYGNIGSELLCRFYLVFDYLNGHVYMKPNGDYKKPFTYNISGLEVIASGKEYEDFRVSYIRPGSPAEQAGIRIGDKIIAVNGQRVTGQDITYFYNLLSYNGNKKITFKLEAKGTQKVYKAPVMMSTAI